MAKLAIFQPQFAPAVFRLKLDVCCFISSHISEQRESFSLLIFATCVLSRVNSLLPNQPVARTACRAKNSVGPTRAFVQSEATSRFLFSFFCFYPFLFVFALLRQRRFSANLQELQRCHSTARRWADVSD